MMIRHLLYIAISGIVLSSCAIRDISEKTSVMLGTVAGQAECIFLSDLFEAKEWIVLDSCKDGILSGVDKIECSGGDIYILDKVRGKCVYRFSKDGKYRNTIGRQGNGRGEYATIYDFTVEPRSGNILILATNSKVYAYDREGAYVSAKTVSEAMLWNMQATGDGIFMSTNHSTHTSGDGAFLLYGFDFSLNEMGRWNVVLPKYAGMLPMSSFVFQETGEGLSYIDQKQNRLFLYDRGKRSFEDYVPLYLPNPRPASHYEDAMAFMDKGNQQKYDWLCEVLRCKGKIIATYFHNGRYCVSVADAVDGRTMREGILAGSKPRIYPLGDDEYIAAVSPDLYLMDDSWTMFATRPRQKVDEGGNMLLVRLKVK